MQNDIVTDQAEPESAGEKRRESGNGMTVKVRETRVLGFQGICQSILSPLSERLPSPKLISMRSSPSTLIGRSHTGLNVSVVGDLRG